MLARLRRGLTRASRSYVLFVVIGLVVGLVLAPAAMDLTGGPDGTVAVVYIDGSIDGQQSARFASAMETARDQADAVVVVANSGGGSAAASESMYLQTRRTARQLPVVVSVDAAAASGAYYAIAPADRVYVKPSSFVGSVGVVAPVPPDVEPNDLIGTTGPNKLTGQDGRAFYYTLETVQRAFVGAVYHHRGDRIELDRDEVTSAAIYLGVEAAENGLADRIGGRRDAIRHAADLAGLERPRIRVLRPDGQRTFLLRSTYLASAAPEKAMTGVDPFVRDAGTPPPLLMIPGGTLAGAEDVAVAGPPGADGLDARNGSLEPGVDPSDPSPAGDGGDG